MPSNRRSLQSQGVPIPEKLKGPDTPNVPTRQSTKISSPTAPTRTTRSRTSSRNRRSRSTSNSSIGSARNYSPTRIADRTTSGVGLLEGEFFAAIVLLVLLMFADSTSSYGDKIMSVIKRGTLVCVLFFVLALLATIGPTMAKVTKAFGALIIIGILLTSPVATMFGDLDSLIKNTWAGSDESGNTFDSDSGTSNATSSASSSELSKIESAVSSAASKMTEAQIPGIGDVIAASPVISAIKKLLGL